MPYTHKYDYQTETAFIGYEGSESDFSLVKCKLCLEYLREGEGEDDCICEWCKENQEEN